MIVFFEALSYAKDTKDVTSLRVQIDETHSTTKTFLSDVDKRASDAAAQHEEKLSDTRIALYDIEASLSNINVVEIQALYSTVANLQGEIVSNLTYTLPRTGTDLIKQASSNILMKMQGRQEIMNEVVLKHLCSMLYIAYRYRDSQNSIRPWSNFIQKPKI